MLDFIQFPEYLEFISFLISPIPDHVDLIYPVSMLSRFKLFST